MIRDVWGIFHDGTIARIDGTIPGTLRLEIDIQYLRAMFPEPGSRFIVTLTGCSKFSWRAFDKQATEDISLIQESEPEILYVTSVEPLVLDCVEGTIELEYEELTITLESGRPVSYESLTSASTQYWRSLGRTT